MPDRIGATLIGVAVTSVIFLSGISFAVQKGNVVETSLILAYVNIPELQEEKFCLHYLCLDLQIRRFPNLSPVFAARNVFSWTTTPCSEEFRNQRTSPSSSSRLAIVSSCWNYQLRRQSTDEFPNRLGAISSLATQTFGAGVEFFSAAWVLLTCIRFCAFNWTQLYRSSALPLPVLVGLFYRIAVMYAASRIILALKRKNEGYEDTKRLSEESSVSSSSVGFFSIVYWFVKPSYQAAKAASLIVAYARLLLIAGELSPHSRFVQTSDLSYWSRYFSIYPSSTPLLFRPSEFLALAQHFLDDCAVGYRAENRRSRGDELEGRVRVAVPGRRRFIYIVWVSPGRRVGSLFFYYYLQYLLTIARGWNLYQFSFVPSISCCTISKALKSSRKRV